MGRSCSNTREGRDSGEAAFSDLKLSTQDLRQTLGQNRSDP